MDSACELATHFLHVAQQTRSSESLRLNEEDKNLSNFIKNVISFLYLRAIRENNKINNKKMNKNLNIIVPDSLIP
jgi:hypothetical protein